jgi:carboxyl-terminal processing protease
MPLRNLLLLILASAASLVCYSRTDHDPYCRYVASGLATIEQNALDAPPGRELFDGAVNGMVAVLHRHGDAHSLYFDEVEAGPLRNEIHQQFGGIGIRFRMQGEPPQPAIMGPVEPGTPAAKAKLKAGDLILAIDERETANLRQRDIQTMLAGEPGTRLKLTIRSEHEQRPRTVELLRDVIPIDSIVGDRRDAMGRWTYELAEDPRIAHIRILSFGDRTTSEFERLMPSLLAKGVQACGLDLRDNAGGSLSAAVGVCETLLPAHQTIVETRGRDATLLQRFTTKVDGKYCDVPVAVIVNQYSASAAEIVAACLQDHQRAVVIGERSFGKGTVQQLLPLGNGLLKLTWASFWRPSGANIQRDASGSANGVWAVTPDAGYERKLSADEYAAYRSYRDQRDENGDRAPEGDQSPANASKTSAFVDEPLQLAERYLASKLKSQAP